MNKNNILKYLLFLYRRLLLTIDDQEGIIGLRIFFINSKLKIVVYDD